MVLKCIEVKKSTHNYLSNPRTTLHYNRYRNYNQVFVKSEYKSSYSNTLCLKMNSKALPYALRTHGVLRRNLELYCTHDTRDEISCRNLVDSLTRYHNDIQLDFPWAIIAYLLSFTILGVLSARDVNINDGPGPMSGNNNDTVNTSFPMRRNWKDSLQIVSTDMNDRAIAEAAAESSLSGLPSLSNKQMKELSRLASSVDAASREPSGVCIEPTAALGVMGVYVGLSRLRLQGQTRKVVRYLFGWAK